MSATIEAALKSLIEAQGLSITAHRDKPPENAALPFVTISAVSLVPDRSGDFGSANEPTVTEMLDVHVWQQYLNPNVNTRTVTESYTLVPALRRALHGAVLAAPPTHTHGVLVVDSRRLLEDEENVVHDVITVEVRRYL